MSPPRLGELVTIGPRAARRAFRVESSRRLEGSFTVRHVLRPDDGGRRLVTYTRPGASIRWNARLYDGPESFTLGPG